MSEFELRIVKSLSPAGGSNFFERDDYKLEGFLFNPPLKIVVNHFFNPARNGSSSLSVSLYEIVFAVQ